MKTRMYGTTMARIACIDMSTPVAMIPPGVPPMNEANRSKRSPTKSE